MQIIVLETILSHVEEQGLMMIKDRVMTALLDDDSEKRAAAQECLRCMCHGTIKQGSIIDGKMILEVKASSFEAYIDVGRVPQDYERSKGYAFTLNNGQ